MSVILVPQEASSQAVAFLTVFWIEGGQRVGEAQKIGAAFLFSFEQSPQRVGAAGRLKQHRCMDAV